MSTETRRWMLRLTLLVAAVVMMNACVGTISPPPSPALAGEPGNSTPLPAPETITPITPPLYAGPAMPLCATSAWELLPSYPRTLPYNPARTYARSGRHIDWSAGGQRLALPDGDTVWIATSPDFVPRPLLQIAGSILGEVRWSPDQAHLAIRGATPETPADSLWVDAIWLADPDGAGAVDLLKDLPDSNWVVRHKLSQINHWLDSQRLAFQVHPGTGLEELWQVDTQTMALTRLVGMWDEETRWTDLQPEPEDLTAAYPPPLVWFDPTRSPFGGSYDFSPVDPSQVVINDLSHISHLAVADVERHAYLRLTTSIAQATQRFLSWIDDGSGFYFMQSEPTETGETLWRWDTASQEKTPIMAQLTLAEVSPDGTRVAFAQGDEETGQFAVRDLNTGATVLVRNLDHAGAVTNDIGQIVWSPDSNAFVYTWGSDELWLASLADACQQRLLPAVKLNLDDMWAAIDVAWSPEGESLALLLPGDQDQTSRLFVLRPPSE